MKNKNGSSRLEVWKEADKNTLKGTGLKVSGRDTILLESIELVFKDDTYWYIPTVPDQNEAKPVPFKLAASDQFKVSFENPDHDFPQRITYHMKPMYLQPYKAMPGDSLFVRVESLSGEGIDFNFLRK